MDRPQGEPVAIHTAGVSQSPPVTTGTFDLLSPHVVISAIEDAFEVELDGTITAYPSYVNRVYEVRETDDRSFIVKFYRPNRWSEEAIAEEHAFVKDCRAFDIPVVAPVATEDGHTLCGVIAED